MRELAAAARGEVIGSSLVYLEEVTSTSDLALALAEEGAPEGLTVVASRQTRGRGKEGRRWESPPGGLWCSTLLRPGCPAKEAPLFTLMGALGAAEAIREVSGLKALLRWPNDLFLHHRKVGGILCEMKTTGHRIRYLVMGIGINVNQSEREFPDFLRDRATSLRLASGRSWDIETLAEALYGSLDGIYGRVKEGDMGPFWERLREIWEASDQEWDRMVGSLGAR